MASVTKLWDATVGYQTGLHGPKRTTLPYQVTVDSVDDNPIDVMKLAGTGVPIGTLHPHARDPATPEFGSLVVLDYIITERMNTLNWRVDAIFAMPLVFAQLQPNVDGWALDWQSTTESYQLFNTLEATGGPEPKGIGSPEYRLATKAEITDPPDDLYETQDTFKHKLLRTGRFIPEPFDRGKPLIAFSLTRRFLTVQMAAVSAALTYLQKVNVELFRYVAADAYTVRFDSISGRSVPSSATGTRLGVEWEIRLDFTYNPEGFTPIKRFHVWADNETGARSFIVDSDEDRIEEEFEVYHLASLTSLMSNFG